MQAEKSKQRWGKNIANNFFEVTLNWCEALLCNGGGSKFDAVIAHWEEMQFWSHKTQFVEGFQCHIQDRAPYASAGTSTIDDCEQEILFPSSSQTTV